MKENITDKIRIIYLWYWHLDPRVNTKEIDEAIKNHDWKTFNKWMEWQKKQTLLYLPDWAEVYINEEYIGQVTITKETFDLITDNDHECG